MADDGFLGSTCGFGSTLDIEHVQVRRAQRRHSRERFVSRLIVQHVRYILRPRVAIAGMRAPKHFLPCLYL
jgi:hypothetical protein